MYPNIVQDIYSFFFPGVGGGGLVEGRGVRGGKNLNVYCCIILLFEGKE